MNLNCPFSSHRASTRAVELLGLSILTAVLGGCSSGPGPAAPQAGASAGTKGVAAAKVASAPAAPKSLFHSDPASGRDPFFPGMSRSVAQKQNNAPAAHLPAVTYLKLGGIWPGKSRPLALINKTPLAPGEERDISITVPNQLNQAEVQKINVRCLEIRQDSVLISIDGEEGVRELRMAQGK